MRNHEVRVQVVVDGARAERGLRERPCEDGRRQPAAAAAQAARAPRGERENQRREDGDRRDDAVRELDVGVVAARQRVLRRARRPMRAAEPRTGERTVAPVATMRMSTPTAARAMRRKTTGETVRARRRGSAADADPACTSGV